MVKSTLRWFRHVQRRLVEALVKRVNQMEGSPIARGRGSSRKIICETIKRDLDVNALNINMIYDQIIWHGMIHLSNPN